jgi:hypothetical protein
MRQGEQKREMTVRERSLAQTEPEMRRLKLQERTYREHLDRRSDWRHIQRLMRRGVSLA